MLALTRARSSSRMWLVATAGGHVSALAALALGALTGAFALLVRVLRDRRHLAARVAHVQAHHARPRGLRRSRLARRDGVRPAAMRIKRLLSWALIAGGLLLLADGALTLLWKEPVSAVYASIQQHKLEGELEKLEQVQPTPAEKTVLARLPDPGLQLAFKARAMRRRAEDGQPIGHLEAPRSA